MSDRQLASGFTETIPANSMKRVEVRAVKLTPLTAPGDNYDSSVSYLSGLTPFAAQRGVGFPQPTYRQDLSFGGQPLRLGRQSFTNGLGCAANTVLIYDLAGRYGRFMAAVGVDQEMARATNPPASVFFTVHVDGMLRFESGPMFKDTPMRQVDLDVRHAGKLMLRMSCNWDDNGNNVNDHGDWVQARLLGRIN